MLRIQENIIIGQMSSERVLESETWPLEAEAVIDDIRKHVRRASVSAAPALRGDAARTHINITTLEERHYCVELSAGGFRVVGRRHDDASIAESVRYETPYALLDSISDAYRQSFGGELMNKLLTLAKSESESGGK